MGELNFTRHINYPPGDRYGSRGGTHYGVDYPAPKGTSVRASESGKVVRAADNPKAPDRPRAYGNVIVIYHNPGKAGPGKTKNRHIYTLYAHLSAMYVKAGDYVEKSETIGAVGNTGTVMSAKGGEGYHLHFEILDSSTELNYYAGSGAMGVKSNRSICKDPETQFNQTIRVEGTLSDMAERAILDRIKFVPDIDLKRKDPVRLKAYLDGKNIGYLNKDNSALSVRLKYDLKEELRKM